MIRLLKIIAGVVALGLWMVEMQVPTTRITAAGDRVYVPSVEWITWLSFLAGVTVLLAARKNAKHPRRLTLAAAFELLVGGTIALNQQDPFWMAVWNLSLCGVLAILSAFSPIKREETIVQIQHPETRAAA